MLVVGVPLIFLQWSGYLFVAFSEVYGVVFGSVGSGEVVSA